MIEFDWDRANIQHIVKHDVTVEEAECVLNGVTLDVDFQDWFDEERFAEVGVTARGRYLVVVTTWRGDRLRVVTAFDAPTELVEEYHKGR